METPAENAVDFGAALRGARLRRGFTLQELSTISGISVSALRVWESAAAFDGRPHLLVNVIAALNKRLTLSHAEERVLTAPVLDVASAMFSPAEAAATLWADLPGSLLSAIHRAIELLGPERLEGIIQGVIATATPRPRPAPPPDALAVHHPTGVTEYVPRSTISPSPPAAKAAAPARPQVRPKAAP